MKFHSVFAKYKEHVFGPFDTAADALSFAENWIDTSYGIRGH